MNRTKSRSLLLVVISGDRLPMLLLLLQRVKLKSEEVSKKDYLREYLGRIDINIFSFDNLLLVSSSHRSKTFIYNKPNTV